jgi:hypothetical protein
VNFQKGKKMLSSFFRSVGSHKTLIREDRLKQKLENHTIIIGEVCFAHPVLTQISSWLDPNPILSFEGSPGILWQIF